MIESPPNLAGKTRVNRAVQAECRRFYKMREVTGHDWPVTGDVTHASREVTWELTQSDIQRKKQG